MILETAILFSIIFCVVTIPQHKNDPITDDGDKLWKDAK
jgi:hypothetical protein